MLKTITVSAGSAGLMAASHYLAERLTGHELHRLESYICGVLLGILLPHALWIALSDGDWRQFKALCAVAAGAGAGTAFAYYADAKAGGRARDVFAGKEPPQ